MMVILKVLTGSRAYGLERLDSDYDYHAVHVVSTSDLLKLGPQPRGHEWDESKVEDQQSWEVGHFLHLATKCNPTVLETFVAPIVDMHPRPMAGDEQTVGEELRALFSYVLTRKRIRDAFLGYAHNQRAKLFKKPDDPTQDQPTDRTWKFAVQYLRVLLTGEELLLSGELALDMNRYGDNGSTANFLRDVRAGRVSLGCVVDRAAELEGRLKVAYEKSTVREEPDLDKINEFLLRVRRAYW